MLESWLHSPIKESFALSLLLSRPWQWLGEGDWGKLMAVIWRCISKMLFHQIKWLRRKLLFHQINCKLLFFHIKQLLRVLLLIRINQLVSKMLFHQNWDTKSKMLLHQVWKLENWCIKLWIRNVTSSDMKIKNWCIKQSMWIRVNKHDNE